MDERNKRIICPCGDSYTEVIFALGHYYRSVVTKQPTTMEAGTMTYTCTRCGHSYTRPIAKLPDDSRDNAGQGGSGNTGQGGSESTGQGGSGNAGQGGSGNVPETGKPFLRDETGKEGWDVIRAETEKAEEGCTVTVEMNGSVVVPGSVLESVKGKDVSIVFDMGNGMSWSVNGRSVTADQIGDIDFSVKTGTDTIPVDIINNVTGESYSIQLSLAHEGEFGFTAALSVNLGRENVGRYAALYYYNRAKACMEFVCEDRIAEDGNAQLPFTHASEYAIVVDEKPAQEDVEGSAAASAAGEEGTTGETPDPAGQETGAAWEPWLPVAIGAVVIIIGIGAWFILRKKKEKR